tara:strand:+ start:600 stop:1046 length:447 start_codon:yes stop_codon:yes gene_type:complete
MTNSDNTFGTFNKQSKEITLLDQADNSTERSQSFSGNVETAKSHFFTDDALTMFNSTATRLQWAITSSGNGLRWTIDFGIPAGSSSASDSWAEKFKSQKTALIDANNFVKASCLYHDTGGAENEDGSGTNGQASQWYWKITDSSDDLF